MFDPSTTLFDPSTTFRPMRNFGPSFRNLDMRMRRFGPSFGLLLRRRGGCGQLSRAPNSEVCSCVRIFIDAWYAGQPLEFNMSCSRCGPCLPVGQATNGIVLFFSVEAFGSSLQELDKLIDVEVVSAAGNQLITRRVKNHIVGL